MEAVEDVRQELRVDTPLTASISQSYRESCTLYSQLGPRFGTAVTTS